MYEWTPDFIPDAITPYYDPLIAKLIIKGENRSDAFHKAKLALEEWKILGLKTNASFLKRLVNDPAVLERKSMWTISIVI